MIKIKNLNLLDCLFYDNREISIKIKNFLKLRNLVFQNNIAHMKKNFS